MTTKYLVALTAEQVDALRDILDPALIERFRRDIDRAGAYALLHGVDAPLPDDFYDPDYTYKPPDED